MAAIDPSAPAEVVQGPNGELPPRATLTIIREPMDADEDDEEDSDDEEYLKALLAGSDEDLSDEEGAEKNGGPSDPSKSEKARMLKAAAEIRAAAEEAEDMDVDVKNGVNGPKAKSDKGKGKGKATGKDADKDAEEEDDDEETEIEEFVLCTLDPAKVSTASPLIACLEGVVLRSVCAIRTTSNRSTLPSTSMSRSFSRFPALMPSSSQGTT